MHPLLIVLLIILVGWIAVGGYTFFAACLRKKEMPWLVESEISKTQYGRFYEYMVFGDQWLREHHAQDVYVDSHDGLKLHAYWIPAENPKGTMILAHGYRSTLLMDFGIAFECYHALGFNLLVPNQRSHGESQGRYITFGVKESEDMLSWIQYHNSNFGAHQIILNGLSMGASTMLYLADADLAKNVKGIVADCGFTSPAQIVSAVFKDVVKLPAAPAICAADLFARVFAGFSLYEKDTRKSLAGAKVPVLLIHGTADNFVPCEMTKEGFASCTGQKKMLLVEGAQHGVSFLVDQESYTTALLTFLKENLEGFA